jgi:hypothetical protein
MKNRRYRSAHTTISPSAIKISRCHRRDFGTHNVLVRSIAEIGLLHPIVIRPDRVSLAGQGADDVLEQEMRLAEYKRQAEAEHYDDE